MFENLKKDLDAVMQRDPAVHSRAEVFFCYPGFKAIRRHRRAHKAYEKGHYFIARWISARTKKKTGIDIHPGAQIGEGFFIDHGTGVVIGETAVIGKNVTLYQGVTLGGTGKDTGKRHPTLGDGVTVGAGAKVLGPINIGNHVKVGAGSIVLKDVPDQCTVVGNPGRIVRGPAHRPDIDLNHGDLPDPMLDKVQALYKRLIHLERSLTDCAEKLGCDACPVEDCPGRERGNE
ncbi:MAG: serine O-acetyltransferase [Clostridiales bacterium]|nr:serine O-acetyltransferase [Clostridiales bacterium]